jgi:hypothetical protein
LTNFADIWTSVADLTSERIEGIAFMGDTPFSVPLISQIDGNLWTGGWPSKGVPPYFRAVLDLYGPGYPWADTTERYSRPFYDHGEMPNIAQV